MSSTSPAITSAERRLRTVLRLVGAALLLAAVGYAAGPLFTPWEGVFREPPFVASSVVKVTVLGLCCLYAAGDIRRRMGLAGLVVAAHGVSVASMALMLAAAPDTGRQLDLPFDPTVAQTLIGAIVLDGAITLAIVALWLPARRRARAASAGAPAAEREELAPAERRLRTLLVPLVVLLTGVGIACLIGPLLDDSERLFTELPFVTNTTVMAAALAFVALYVRSDVPGNLPLAGPLAFGHGLYALVALVYIQFLDTGYRLPLGDGDVLMTDLLWATAGAHAAAGAAVLAATLAAWRSRQRATFFRPLEYRALEAASEVLVAGRDERISTADIAARVESYIARVRARRRFVYRICFFALQHAPLLTFRPPLSELDPDQRRRFLERWFRRRLPGPDVITRWPRVMIRIAQQLAFAGYYGDPRTFDSVGYEPFSQRGREVEEPGEHPLAVQRGAEVGSDVIEADVCIVGSGAAGGILAYELARAGREVLVVEKGPYVEPREFTDDEVEMIGRLYGDGVMQQTRDFRFTILQGSCVGGSTTVNNAVCFDPPEAVLARWNDPSGQDAGIELAALENSVREVRRFLRVHRQTDARLNPSGRRFMAGVAATGGAITGGIVDANIVGCPGTGYCNIGCRYGAKLSTLETALPWAQRDFPGRVRILSECEVERIRWISGKPKRVGDLRASVGAGRTVTIKARTYVLAAGAVHSSFLMMRSGIDGGLPIGRAMSFNMGAPLTALMPEKIDAYDGLQISHYGMPRHGSGFVYEAWFNPPVSQAVNLPGWFEDHFDNMRSYDHLMAAGALVGTQSNARVRHALMGGPDVVYRPARGDLQTLGTALEALGKIMFDAGAERVMANSWGYEVFERREDLARLPAIFADPGYVTLGTGHPQGGNAIGRDPKRGVVGEDFAVHGFDDLYVCDASVFPTSLTVNPQLTVMALAHYAAPRIA